jgi:hypothetical protein
MSPRLTRFIALWFVLQIILPFTAPLQTLALCDLFPAGHHHNAPVSRESSATPTLRSDAATVTLVSLLEASTLRISTLLAAEPPLASRGLPGSVFQYAPLPSAQQTILRL